MFCHVIPYMHGSNRESMHRRHASPPLLSCCFRLGRCPPAHVAAARATSPCSFWRVSISRNFMNEYRTRPHLFKIFFLRFFFFLLQRLLVLGLRLPSNQMSNQTFLQNRQSNNLLRNQQTPLPKQNTSYIHDSNRESMHPPRRHASPPLLWCCFHPGRCSPAHVAPARATSPYSFWRVSISLQIFTYDTAYGHMRNKSYK